MTGASEKPTQVPQYTMRDDADLRWYFGIGQTAFERSTFGGMLDRASQHALKLAWPKIAVVNAKGFTIGYESAITARPTAEVRAISGYVPDDAVLTRYAHVSSMMMRVERKDRDAAIVIAVFFGDAGEHWATSDTGQGRNGALYHLTAKGRALIEASAKLPGAIQLTAPERMSNICIANKAQPKQERTAALAICARQAEDIERQARAVWHSLKST